MKKVLCFGELLIDFLNTGRIEEGELTIENFRQYPGGAPANVAVAVAKLGGRAAFAGQVGDDKFGRFLQQSLQAYKVDVSLLSRHPTAPTALAFVFLDASGERSFEFYRDNTADLLLPADAVRPEWFDGCAITHICSNTLVEPSILDTTKSVVTLAKRQGCLVSFDVNLRHNLWPGGSCDANIVWSVIADADLVKASKEEAAFLEPRGPDAFLERVFEGRAKLLLITDGAQSISVHTRDDFFHIEPPRVTAVDTTAAGDAFVGGFLYSLSTLDDSASALHSRADLEAAVRFAARCGAFTVLHPGSMTALPTQASLRGSVS